VSSDATGDEQGSTQEKISKKYVICFILDGLLEKTSC